MSTRKEQKQRARERRLELEAALHAQARRKRWRTGIAVAASALLAGGAVVVKSGGTGHTPPASALPAGALAPLATLGKLTPPDGSGPVGPEAVPIPDASPLAAGGPASSSTVDGIQCQGSEQVLFHIHAHLTVFVDGMPREIPYGIGIPGAQASATPAGPYVAAGSCFYWLHTHAADGIIHIESPVQRTFTLGNFFDIWGQDLTPARVGPLRGPVTALYNGRVFRGSPRDIPLTRHAQIQIDVGRPLVAPVHISFPAGL
jgi:hypothetical protein